MSGLDCLGADEVQPRRSRRTAVGFDLGLFSSLFKAAGGAAEGAIEAKEADDQSEAAARKEADKVSAAIAADNAAAVAMARADFSALAKSSTAALDKSAADNAVAAQDKAGADLSDDGQAKRAAAADKAMQTALDRARAKPSDKYQLALAKAWTTVANKAHNNAITASDDSSDGSGKGKGKGKKGGGSGESWWTRPVIGPLPGTAVAVGGAGAAVGLGLLIKRFLFKG